MRNSLADVVKLIERIQKYDDVPVRYHARLKIRFDSVSGKTYVDMRALLTIRLLKLSKAPRVARWITDWKNQALAKPLSPYDKGLIARLL